jgi:hypothetical protein
VCSILMQQDMLGALSLLRALVLLIHLAYMLCSPNYLRPERLPRVSAEHILRP